MGLHYFSCIWQMLQTDRMNRGLDVQQLPSATLFIPSTTSSFQEILQAYLYSFYFTSITVTCTGFGDIVAEDEVEIVYALAIMAFGYPLFIFLIGLMISLLKRELYRDRHLRNRLNLISLYMKTYKIPIKTANRVYEYFRILWERQKGILDEEFLSKIPARQRRRIIQEQVMPLLHALPFEVMLLSIVDHNENDISIEGINDLNKYLGKNNSSGTNTPNISLNKKPTTQQMILMNFYENLAGYMKQEYISPDTKIIERGRSNRKLYFLLSGKVLIKYNSQVLAVNKQAILGYQSFLSNAPSDCTIMTSKYCDILTIDRSNFLQLLQYYPSFKHVIIKAFIHEEELALKNSKRKTHNLNDYVIYMKDENYNEYYVNDNANNLQRIYTPIFNNTIENTMMNKPNFKSSLSILARKKTNYNLQANSCFQKLALYAYTNKDKTWNIIRLICTIYYLLIIPYRAAYWKLTNSTNLLYVIIDYCIDIFFIINDFTLFMFYFPKANYNTLDFNLMKLKIYFKTQTLSFIIDFFSIIPLDLIILLFINKFSIWLRWLYLFRLNHILRVFRLLEYISTAELQLSNTKSNALVFLRRHLQVIKVMFLLILFGHFSACLWTLLSYIQKPLTNSNNITGGWMEIDAISVIDNEYLSYARSFMFILTTMTTIGYGGLKPSNTLERIIISFWVLIATVLYLMVLSSLTVIVDDLSTFFQNMNYVKKLSLNFYHKKRFHIIYVKKYFII